MREINLWTHLFARVILVGPCEAVVPPTDCVPFAGSNIELSAVPPTGGDGIATKIRQLTLMPLLVWRICRALVRGDAVHVRCPGNLGLLGVLFAPLFCHRMVAKYAGQWNGFPGEKWTVRLQRAVLRSRWWRGPVTVYGKWPDQPPNVTPFFTSVLTDAQVDNATKGLPRSRSAGSLHLLFVGRLTGPKNVSTLLHAMARVHRAGIDVRCTIVGDGGERHNLEALAEAEGIDPLVHFAGALGTDEVLKRYEQADTLVLVSESEGWPKAIAEAMTFGLVCVGSDRGMVPQMLGDGRGFVVPPGDDTALERVLRHLASQPDEGDEMGRRASEWGRRHSLEGLQAAIADLLSTTWRVPIGQRAERTSVLHVTDTLEAGGAERVAVNLVNLLPRADFRPYLCTTRREGVLAGEISPDVGRLALERTGRIDDLAAIRRLTHFLRSESIDIVHAHGTSLFISAIAKQLAPGTCLVWHDHLGATTDSRNKRRWLFRLAAARADHVITVSHQLEAWVTTELNLPAARVTTIPNFVITGPEPLPAVDLPGSSGERIVCVANLRRQKDHLTLLEAMALLARAEPTAHALLLGTPIDPTVQVEIKERVRKLGLGASVSFLGTRSDVPAVLAECAIGVLSSSSEGFPLALLEYGHAGLPVVATDVGECSEILDDGRAGVVVPAGDHRALANALLRLLTDPVSASRMGQRLRRRVEHRYSADAVLAQVEQVYESVIGADRGSSPTTSADQ